MAPAWEMGRMRGLGGRGGQGRDTCQNGPLTNHLNMFPLFSWSTFDSKAENKDGKEQ